MKNHSLIPIMSIAGKDKHQDFSLKDTIYESMLLIDTSAPATFRMALEWFWVASSILGMLH